MTWERGRTLGSLNSVKILNLKIPCSPSFVLALGSFFAFLVQQLCRMAGRGLCSPPRALLGSVVPFLRAARAGLWSLLCSSFLPETGPCIFVSLVINRSGRIHLPPQQA